jgi:endoglucanase
MMGLAGIFARPSRPVHGQNTHPAVLCAVRACGFACRIDWQASALGSIRPTVTTLCIPRRAASWPLTVCLALLAVSCLVPPKHGRDSATERPREFVSTSTQLLRRAVLGWNVGNSLDAPPGETAWGNPRVSPELMEGVAQAGFGLVRIPVTWTYHMGPAPDYVLERRWLKRVDEVVGYARAAGLYAVINIHHDGADGSKGVQWLTLEDAAGNTTDANNAAVTKRFVKVWSQIAKHFSGYGEELLFESMNEIHDGYGAADPKHMAFINELNQAFVEVVRSSGGNNGKRFLVVPGYNTNIDHTIAGFRLPNDPTPNRLILSIHYYDPYLFTLMAEKHTWGRASPGRDDWGQEDFVVKQFDQLKTRYVDQGVPVLLGEYGATQQDGFEDYRRYYLEYVTKAAVDRGILPVLWDNGGPGSGADKFRLLDRNTGTVVYPHIMDALRRAATSSYSLGQIALPKASD